jgi:hypothetical protein
MYLLSDFEDGMPPIHYPFGFKYKVCALAAEGDILRKKGRAPRLNHQKKTLSIEARSHLGSSILQHPILTGFRSQRQQRCTASTYEARVARKQC